MELFDGERKMIISEKLITLIVWRNNKVMVAVDRKECFDKVSKCPILLPVPKTEKQVEFLSKKMEWLLTKKGYVASRRFKFDEWITEYPKKIQRKKEDVFIYTEIKYRCGRCGKVNRKKGERICEDCEHDEQLTQWGRG